MAKKPFFCDDCGTRNTSDSKYCKECGEKIHVAYQTLALSEHDRIDDEVQQERLTQFLDMAFWHTEAGNTDAALRACEAALAINPNSTTGHSLLGCLYEKKGEDALAIEHFERVLALNPDSEADRAKLQQLREGVHAQPVRASPVYRWLPPVLGSVRFSGMAGAIRERWADLRSPEMTLLPVRPTPALAVGAVAIVVLAVGLFMVKPAPPSGATGTSRPAPAPLNPAVSRSAVAGSPASRPAAPPYSAPVVMPPLPARPPAIAAMPRTDPFAGRVPLAPDVSTDVVPEAMHRNVQPLQVRTAKSGGLHALPPLKLVAVPPASEGPLPPAPVKVPSSLRMASGSPYDGVARHTVVVQRLSSTPSEFTSRSLRPAASAGQDNAPSPSESPAPPPHIEITIDRGSDNSSASGSGDSGPLGETYQQSAFALQQQGDYRRARATYEKAVHAYQAQIATGHDAEAAQRGLQACKTGLQICQQSQ